MNSSKRPGLVEKRLNELLWLEGKQIIDFLSHANESDGKAQFASNRDHNAAFGRAVEFCQNDARNTRSFRELPGLFESILPSCGVEYQPDLVRRTRNNALARPAHLFEFCHQILFRVEPSGSVNDDVVAPARFGGL